MNEQEYQRTIYQIQATLGTVRVELQQVTLERDALQARLKLADELAEALEAVEWKVDHYFLGEYEGKALHCPWCGGANDYPFEHKPEHRKGCMRQQALAAWHTAQET